MPKYLILFLLVICSLAVSAQQPPQRKETPIRGANSLQWLVQPAYQDGGPEQRAVMFGRAQAGQRTVQALLIISCGTPYNETMAGISLRVPSQIVTLDTSSYDEKDPDGEFDVTVGNSPQQHLGIGGGSPYNGAFDFSSGFNLLEPGLRSLVDAKGQMLVIRIPATGGKGDPVAAAFRLPLNNAPLLAMLQPFIAKAEAAQQELLARRTESCPTLPGKELADAVMLIGRDRKGIGPDMDSDGLNKAAGGWNMDAIETPTQRSQPHTLRCSYALTGHVPANRELKPSDIVDTRLVPISRRTVTCDVNTPPYVVQCYSK